MISRIWSGESFLWCLLLPLSWIYGLISGGIRFAYRVGLKQSWKAPVPVVVVGNLTVGGNGKTPVVIWLVEQLSQRGILVGVVSRGYGGKATQYPLLLNDMTSASEAGDEPILIYQRTGVPVAVSPNRVDAVRSLLAEYAIQIIIADDGLQHYALKRDKEIVVIDGVRRFGNGWWLPAGPMRERASRLHSVDAIILNGGKVKPGEILMQITSGQAINLRTGERRDVAQLPALFAMAGIGYPQRFFNMLEKNGAWIENRISLTDHQELSYEKIISLTEKSKTLIMTEKDAVKYRSFAQDNWWYLPIEVNFSCEQSKKMLQDLIKMVY